MLNKTFHVMNVLQAKLVLVLSLHLKKHVLHKYCKIGKIGSLLKVNAQ